MGKVLNCSDLVAGCSAVFRGATDEEVIRQATEHSRSVHHLSEIPKSLQRKMQRLIRDDRKKAA